jgi:hypothetical protein
MAETQQNGGSGVIGPDAPMLLDIRKLQPVEVVLLSRYATNSSTGDFPTLDCWAVKFERHVECLPETDLAFAREVYSTFAVSPFPIDRLNLGHMIRYLTRADHDAGVSLWHQLVRDEHFKVRRVAYDPVRSCLRDRQRPPEERLAELGLTLTDAHRLRDAFIDAQFPCGRHIVSRTAIAEALETATESFASLANLAPASHSSE